MAQRRGNYVVTLCWTAAAVVVILAGIKAGVTITAGWRMGMFEKSIGSSEPVLLSERFAGSQAFAVMFRDGMALVEETASYLDGQGRKDAKLLARTAALTYATESMRLTTRLMQLASWLLLHRAVREGEMSLSQASKEKSRVKFSPLESGGQPNLELLPEPLQDLIARANDLQAKVRRFDASIHSPAVSEPVAAGSPVSRQLGLLRAAFEQDAR